MSMVMTILESHVAPEKQPALLAAFESATAQLDAGIEQTFLARSNADPTLWRIMTVWRDREALDAMRASGETPRGVLIFREAGAEPSLTVFTIVDQESIATLAK
jgi:quinol monooxygenase YgiN